MSKFALFQKKSEDSADGPPKKNFTIKPGAKKTRFGSPVSLDCWFYLWCFFLDRDDLQWRSEDLSMSKVLLSEKNVFSYSYQCPSL